MTKKTLTIESPVRVDFAGGWLDTPDKNYRGGYVVNCAVSPKVTKDNWIYDRQSGLGGSSAWAVVNGIDPFEYDKEQGNGWQDAAVILKTGCCVWHSGNTPILDSKSTGDFLKGVMALYNTRIPHSTAHLSLLKRDIQQIIEISKIAREGVLNQDLEKLGLAIHLTYQEQLKEGMKPIPYQDLEGLLGAKYCGSGHGGYIVYLFKTSQDRQKALQKESNFMAIEPYCRTDD